MHDEEDLTTITVRCRIKDCGYRRTYLPENSSDLLPILKGGGWRFAHQGERTLPVCPRQYT